MPKSIVVCFDGTDSEYSTHNTNVVCLVEAIERDADQVIFYDPGVGTYSYFGLRIANWYGRIAGLIGGYGIRRNVMEGYEFLMNTWEAGAAGEPCDRIYIFGFSRGAYTARALAGMIGLFGILHPRNTNLLPYVKKMYFKKRRLPADETNLRLKKKYQAQYDLIEGFGKTFCRPCDPYFIGLWDTVGALARRLAERFPNLKLNEKVRFGYQALSLDEVRAPYDAILWDKPRTSKDHTVEQVWFPGAHSEVGGGCRKDNCALPNFSLEWMLKKAASAGLRVKPQRSPGPTASPTDKIHQAWPWVLRALAALIGRCQGKRWHITHRREPRPDTPVHRSVDKRRKADPKYAPNLKGDYTVVD